MAQRLSEKAKENIQKLRKEGSSVKEIAKRANVSYSTAYGYTKVKQRGFESLSEYQEHLVKQRGFKSRTEYETHLVRERGFKSRSDYQEHLARERQQRPENKELSNLIKKRLKELEKNQSWLADQIGVTSATVSFYTHGKSIPSNDVLKKLSSALEVPYKTLEDILG